MADSVPPWNATTPIGRVNGQPVYPSPELLAWLNQLRQAVNS